MTDTEHNKSDILIVLDVDETLIHATDEKLNQKEDFKVFDYFVYKRPHLQSFLEELYKHFRLGIWSSASDDFVEEVIKVIAPEHIDFEMIWGRSRCSFRRDIEIDRYYYEKRLKKLKRKGHDLDKILLIDDTPEKARRNYGNAIYIQEFTGDKEDNELQILLKYLISLKDVENVRAIEKRGWKNSIEK